MTTLTDVERFVEWAELLDLSAREAFEKAAELLDHHGVESCSLDQDDYDCDYCMEYLNQGDTYALTLVLTDDLVNGVALIATSWGDWYEECERHYCEENGAIRCAYCGHFTDDYSDEETDWNEVVCESCGHHVDGSD